MTIAHDHAAVQAEIPGLTGRHGFDLGGEHILFLDIVLFLEDLEQRCLHRLLFLVLQRLTAQDDIQSFAGDHFGGLLAHLLGGQVDQQIADAHHRVGGILTNDDVHFGAVLLAHHAVQRQRTGHPLVLLDTAVVVGIGVGKISIFIEGVLLQVDAGRVGVSAYDVDALIQRMLTDEEQHHGFIHAVDVHLVAGVQELACLDGVLHVDVAGSLGHIDGGQSAFTLGLACIQKGFVAGCRIFQSRQSGFVIGFPCIGTFHIEFPPFDAPCRRELFCLYDTAVWEYRQAGGCTGETTFTPSVRSDCPPPPPRSFRSSRPRWCGGR